MDWNKLWKILKKKGSKTPQVNHVPLMHEVIDLESFQEEELIEWKKADKCGSIMDQISSAETANQNALPNPLSHIDFLDHAHSSGFVWMCDPSDPYSVNDFRFLQHDFYLKLLKHGYSLSLADARSISKKGNLQLTYKYYLKPRRNKNLREKSEQAYGNISIELVLINDEPYMFRLMAHTYSDRNYLPAKPREGLMRILMGS